MNLVLLRLYNNDCYTNKKTGFTARFQVLAVVHNQVLCFFDLHLNVSEIELF